MNQNITIFGTGSVGSAIGGLLRHHGIPFTFGARNPAETAARLAPEQPVLGFQPAADGADIIVLAIPWAGGGGTAIELLKSLRALDGKIIIDATNPLGEDWSPLLLGEESSAGEEIQKALPQTLVVKAFNTVFADMMKAIDRTQSRPPVTGFYCGDDEDAKTVVAELLGRLGFEARDVGALSSARWLEAMAHLNIRIAVNLKGGTHAYFTYQTLQV